MRNDPWSPWIENYVTEERFRFWTGDLPDGMLRNQLFVKAGNRGVPPHIHTHADERFIVNQGVMGYRVGKETGTLRAGEQRVLPKGVVHTWWNAGDGDMLITGEWMPGDRGEESLRRVCTVMNTLHDRGRKPSLPVAAVVLNEYSDVLKLPAPIGWTPVMKSLAMLGRMLGHGWAATAPLATHETAPVREENWEILD